MSADIASSNYSQCEVELSDAINTLDPVVYQSTYPYPYTVIDNFLPEERANNIQKEILQIESSEWDRYSNPFEQKYTLRNKYNFPPLLNNLFDDLTSESFTNKLSSIVGYPLILDSTRNFWGVHKYKNGDKLDIHVDAGYHPTINLKKQITLGLYLSDHWREQYGCHLEVWKGSSCMDNDAKLIEKVDSISPMFNRCIIFTCNDYSWHGNPSPVCADDDATRIFVTISYLSENNEDKNTRKKAYFIETPDHPYDAEKQRLRDSRADEQKYKEVYRI